MKHCKNCGVDVNTHENYCPLCFNKVEGENTNTPMYSTSPNKPKTIMKEHKTRKIFELISLFIIAVCGFINVQVGGQAWSVIVGIGIVYMWIMVRHTILSHRSSFEKVMLQLIGIVGLLLTTNLVTGGGLWFLEVVLPAVLIALSVVLDMVLFISKRRKQFELGFFIINVIILIVSIIFVSTNFFQFKLLYWMLLLLNILSIVGIMLFDGKNLRGELSKKFHL